MQVPPSASGRHPRLSVETPRFERRLSIVVPYRDRADHLRQFVPHLLAYFDRDKLDRSIPYRIHIVEQAGRGAFNRGALKNCGFVLGRHESDYVCFHDVDYLPIWADYSFPDQPSRLIWHGLTLRENYHEFFGAVVMFPNEAFERINGYSNEYRGWGFEDSELRLRVALNGMDIAMRDGTFLSLPHEHGGRSRDGALLPDAEMNRAKFQQRVAQLREHHTLDGLKSLKFSCLATEQVAIDGQRLSHVFHHLVDIDHV